MMTSVLVSALDSSLLSVPRHEAALHQVSSRLRPGLQRRLPALAPGGPDQAQGDQEY